LDRINTPHKLRSLKSPYKRDLDFCVTSNYRPIRDVKLKTKGHMLNKVIVEWDQSNLNQPN